MFLYIETTTGFVKTDNMYGNKKVCYDEDM